MKLARILVVVIGITLLVAAIGCSVMPLGEVAPTPNIEATVEVRVAHERAVDATVEVRVAQERVAQERAIDAAVVVRLNELVGSQPTQTPVAVVREVVPTDTPIPTDNPVPAVRATAVSAASNPQEASVQQEQSSKQDWVTLTDIEKIFSITVPMYWDTAIDKGRLSTEYQSLFEQGLMVLFFGVNTQTGSNVTLIADMQALVTEEPQPIDRAGYVELQVQDLEQKPNIGEVSKKEVTIDGINGTQLRYVMGGEVNQIAYILLGNEPRMACGSMGVLMTGTAPDAALAVVEQILDSLRVLPTAAITDTCDDRKALSMLEVLGSVVGATEEGMVEVDGLRLIEWEVKSYEQDVLTIVGVIENTTNDLKEGIFISFDVYGKDGYSLGTAEGFIERLQSGKKWRFEAIAVVDGEIGEIIPVELTTVY